MTQRALKNRAALIAFFCLGAFAPVQAAENPPAKAAYLKYCGACHGAEGKGDGVVSGFMRPHPTDLSKAAKNADGTFPAVRMGQSIDGTLTVRAHGDPDMPVWGEIFRHDAQGSVAPAAVARGQVQLIVEHIRTLQEK